MNVTPLKHILPVKQIIEDTTPEDFRKRAEMSAARVGQEYQVTKIVSSVSEVAEKIRQLLIEQNCSCNYCGTLFEEGNYEIDHITPLTLGGLHSVGNIQLLCQRCNRSKGARTEGEFLAWIQRIAMHQWSKTEGAQAKAEKLFLKQKKFHKYKKKPKRKD